MTHKKKLQNDGWFIDRRLSWLAFNDRVLEESCDSTHPLLERARFLAISARNLDEFYTIRMGDKSTDDHKVQSAIEKSVKNFIKRQQKYLHLLRTDLAKLGIQFIKPSQMTKSDKAWLNSFLLSDILPLLTPLALDWSIKRPPLPSLALMMIVSIQGKSDVTSEICVPIPQNIPHYITLPGQSTRIITLEHALQESLKLLFPQQKILKTSWMRLAKDGEIDFEDNVPDLIGFYRDAIHQRKNGPITLACFAKGFNPSTKGLLENYFQIPVGRILIVDGALHLRGLDHLIALLSPSHPEWVYKPLVSPMTKGIDYFSMLKERELLLHHPYDAFDTILDFIRQAVYDPQVISIKQTLYRTGPESKIVKLLIAAAQKGKSVTAIIEIKARFDENTNIDITQQLEKSGVQVLQGPQHLKTHAKMTHIIRKEGGTLRHYMHFGTGNYNSETAKIYTDISLLTTSEVYAEDSWRILNFLSSHTKPDHLTQMSLAPFTLRNQLLERIQNETGHAKAGRKGHIWAKMNALTDEAIIKALYAASQAGVKIQLIVRGICCLRPGVKGLSENIHVKSIIGRFLEHSRIFAFGDGHAIKAGCTDLARDIPTKVYFSSADWMSRNFDRRLEVMVHVNNPQIRAHLMQILAINLADKRQSWTLKPNGKYDRVSRKHKGFSAQKAFIKKGQYASFLTEGIADSTTDLEAGFSS